VILSPWQAGSEALLSHGVPLASDAHQDGDWIIPKIHKLQLQAPHLQDVWFLQDVPEAPFKQQ